MNLSTPIEEISRVGPQSQRRLKKLGVKTVKDLLFHFPHRYEDFSNLIPLSMAEEKIGETVCVQGKVAKIKNIRIFRRRMVITEALLQDETGTLKITWFNQPYLINTFKPGDFLFLAGKMFSKNGKKYLSSPSYEKIPAQFAKPESKGDEPKDSSSPFAAARVYDSTHVGRLIPVYPETEGMSSRWLRFVIKPLLTEFKNAVPEALPENIRKENNLLEMEKAIWQIHFPDSLKEAELARKRFIFEELFDLSLMILKEKIALSKEKTVSIPINLDLIRKFVNLLPFKLTSDQKKSAWQIMKDMEKPTPMNRLLNGDVGSGKTVVAIMAALNAVKAGFQVALMAPTEILAKQHHKTLITALKKFKLKIGLITGKENFIDGKKLKRNDLFKRTKEGKIDILVGTHALVQKTVEFKKLALVIIDEQHRFGIEQRMNLAKKQNFLPHLLSMSATPIPRTLALTVYGDLDLSLIREMPKGRKKIITRIIPPAKRNEAYDFIRKEAKSGRQVFVICPRIEPSSAKANGEQAPFFNERNYSWQEAKAVKEEFEKLKKEIFPDLQVTMLHGRMKTEEKEKALKSFRNGKTDILVSTSVIEVGIDFPNATIMMIEGADKFGLAQLHQFRGRVGRGEYQSYCFLFSEFSSNPRLRAMTIYQDGFELAEKDLKLRGPGDLTGQRQWGIPDLVMASLGDIELVEKTRQTAKTILQQDPELKNHPLLKARMKEFHRKIHLE
jgi:ATP-dependent DNA helicase RecG